MISQKKRIIKKELKKVQISGIFNYKKNNEPLNDMSLFSIIFYYNMPNMQFTIK